MSMEGTIKVMKADRLSIILLTCKLCEERHQASLLGIPESITSPSFDQEVNTSWE